MGPLFWSVLGFLAVERCLELGIHRRNAVRLRARGARWFGRDDGIIPILGAQAMLFGGILAEVGLSPWAGIHPWTPFLLGGVVLAQILRYWCIHTLGDRWVIRVVTVSDAPRVTRGPYRFFPHPNYVAVMLEVAALALAFGAWWTFAIATVAHLGALRARIRVEERALGEASSEWHSSRP